MAAVVNVSGEVGESVSDADNNFEDWLRSYDASQGLIDKIKLAKVHMYVSMFARSLYYQNDDILNYNKANASTIGYR